MTKKLTPQEAWERVRALIPSASCMYMSGGVVRVREAGGHEKRFEQLQIDWPEGVDIWPPKETERKWRDARMPEDWGKPVQYFFTKKCLDFYEGTLVGYHGDDPSFVVLDKDEMELYWASKVQVEDIPAQAQTPPNTTCWRHFVSR